LPHEKGIGRHSWSLVTWLQLVTTVRQKAIYCTVRDSQTAAKPQAQLASTPEGSVIPRLSLGSVGKLISAPRPKVTAAERQV